VFVSRALAPAKLKSVHIDKDNRIATVLVDKEQVSLAIGRNGQNIRLATKLTGYELNLVKEGTGEEYDMDLSEFIEELGEDLYHKFFDEGYETARSVLDVEDQELIDTFGLEPEKISQLKALLRRGLEEAEVEEEELGNDVKTETEPSSQDQAGEEIGQEEEKNRSESTEQ
jgi:N utilization substance protein A